VTRRFGGSGLGLAIARKLIQMMGGDISCDSAPGVGSEFYFSLPLELAPAVAIEPPEAELSPARRLVILVAEDHPINRRVIEAMLGDSAELVMAENGMTALEAFGAQAFDLVLMDTHMPVMDGLTAIRAIRAAEVDGMRTPIISLTADAMPQQIAAALTAGADLHLAKPITGTGLFAAIDQVIRLAAEAGARATMNLA
jgi:CheY-like chemotaxis protein